MKMATFLAVSACLVTTIGCNTEQVADWQNGMVKSGRKPADANTASIVGKWKGSFDIPKPKKDDPSSQMGAAFAKAMMSNINLELKADKSFKLTMFFPIEGKWEVSGRRITLRAEKFLGMTQSEMKKMGGASGNQSVRFNQKPMSLEISADGKKLIMSGSNPKDGTLEFTRE